MSKTIPLSEATFEQLKDAAERMGLEVKHGNNAAQIRYKLEAAVPGLEEITVDDDDDLRAARTSPGTDISANAPNINDLGHHADPRVTIRIPSTKEPGGDRDVPVGVNGTIFLIRRDEKVEVPYRVYEALNHAVETKYEFKQTGLESAMHEREAHAYEFSVLREPPEEEVRAWRARTDVLEVA